MRSRVESGATVTLYQLVGCAVTGNIISNDIYTDLAAFKGPTPTNRSLILQSTPVPDAPAAAVAVTGNVLIGDEPVWPSRPQSAAPLPLNTWSPLNTVMRYFTGFASPAGVPERVARTLRTCHVSVTLSCPAEPTVITPPH